MQRQLPLGTLLRTSVALTVLTFTNAAVLPSPPVFNGMFLSHADDEEFEDEVESEIEDAIDSDVETEVEEDIEADIEASIDEGIEADVESNIEEDLESALEQEIEDQFEDDDFDDEEFDDEEFDDEDDDFDEDENEDEHDEDDEIEVAAPFDIDLDARGDRYIANEYLLVGPSDEITTILQSGIVAETVTDLDSLDLQLAKISTLGSTSFEDVESILADIAPNTEIDVNHLYLVQQESARIQSPDFEANSNSNPPLSEGTAYRIGVIDSEVDLTHTSLENRAIVARDFVGIDAERPTDHGTAIASLLIGQSDTFSGLLPNAQLFAASVFFETSSGASSARTDSLVSALDWLVSEDVDAINMSLSGPPNLVLSKAVESALANEVTLVAAVGNDGPNAPLRYPAAYDGVVGVTAISSEKKVYRLAGRGEHVDFSAPGVRIRHATNNELFEQSSGTSFAAPVVTAVFAVTQRQQGFHDVFSVLAHASEDLGAVGFDPIYGHGLIRPLVKLNPVTTEPSPELE